MIKSCAGDLGFQKLPLKTAENIDKQFHAKRWLKLASNSQYSHQCVNLFSLTGVMFLCLYIP